MSYTNWVFLNNSAGVWLLAAVVAVVAYAGLRTVQVLVLRHLRRLSSRTANDLDDAAAAAVGHTKHFFILFVSVYAAARVLVLPESADEALISIGVVVMVVQAALWGNALINNFLRSQMSRRIEDDAATATTINAIGFIVRIAFYSILILFGLHNLGVNITAAVAGLGIGGIAVALALQNVLGDLFGSLAIVLDKPFIIGDFIIVGDMQGTVEYIGLKTTRVRSLSGEQLVFSNSDLLNSRIRNYKRMQERRIAFDIGVTYQTPRTLLEQIPNMIRETVESQGNARFDRSHFKKFGAFSIDFETVYYVLQPDYAAYMDTQQAINLDIHRKFEDAGVEFAYPTQTLILSRDGG